MNIDEMLKAKQDAEIKIEKILKELQSLSGAEISLTIHEDSVIGRTKQEIRHVEIFLTF